MGNLSRGMHACIGTTRTGNDYLMPCNLCNGHLQHILHGATVRLRLPAFEVATVIFDRQNYAWHERTPEVIRSCSENKPAVTRTAGSKTYLINASPIL
jgi:hypothetical protein